MREHYFRHHKFKPVRSKYSLKYCENLLQSSYLILELSYQRTFINLQNIKPLNLFEKKWKKNKMKNISCK